MKKIILLLLITTQSYAADFTITLSGGSSKSAKTIKGDGVVIGDSFITGFQDSFVIINDIKWAINYSASSIDTSGKGDFLGSLGSSCFYTSSDCSGSCYFPTINGIKSSVTNAGFSFGSNRILIVGVQTVSNPLTLNSCKEPYHEDNYCATDIQECGGESSIVDGNNLKTGIKMRVGEIFLRSSYSQKPAHNFKFHEMIIE